MKYLVVTPYFPTDESFRGSFIFDQAMALRRAGKDVVVMKSTSSLNAEPYEYNGLTVNQFHTLETPSYMFNGLFNGLNARSFVRAVEKLGIADSDIEAVHCHTGPFGIYGLALKERNEAIKVLLQHHGKDPYTIMNGRLAGWGANFRFRATNSIKIFNRVDLHVCISDHVKENLLRFPGAASDERYEPYLRRLHTDLKLPTIGNLRCVTLYNGVDSRKFSAEGHKGIDGRFVIGCVGNFNALKGQYDLIKAVELIRQNGDIRELKVVFIGSGDTYDECRSYVYDSGLDDVIEFQPERPHEQIAEAFKGFDLFVMPTRFEGFGCVFVEAAACGVPFMVCRSQGATEYIAPEELDRWTIEPGDYRSLARIITDYHTHRYPQRLIHPYDIDTLIASFIDTLDKL